MLELDDDILVELSNDEIDEYRLSYKNLDVKDYVYVHLYLRNQLQWNIRMLQYTEEERNEISDRCKMRFYLHRNGKIEWRTIVGVTGVKEYSLFVMTMEDSLNELKECLEKTKVIQWERLPLCVAIHERFHRLMYEQLATRNVRVRFDNRCSAFRMDRETASHFDYSVPDDVTLSELNVNNYGIMNETWQYKYPGSDCFIKSLIKLNGGLGVYRNGELISWILQVECFGIGLLQTIEQYRGKGYARLLTRAMTQLISKKFDEDVILFATHSNLETVELYRRYGFQCVAFTHWFHLEHSRE